VRRDQNVRLCLWWWRMLCWIATETW